MGLGAKSSEEVAKARSLLTYRACVHGVSVLECLHIHIHSQKFTVRNRYPARISFSALWLATNVGYVSWEEALFLL
jgi:hypothetical protein